MSALDIPTCPTDGSELIATVAGWRCALCGLAVLRGRNWERDRAIAAHPAARRKSS